MIFSILVFVIVVVLPVVGFVWLGDYLKETLGLDPDAFKESLESLNKLNQL